MNTFRPFQEYKHDIPGKFNDIKRALEGIDESNLQEPESVEILLEIHKVLLRMVETSKVIIEKVKNEDEPRNHN